MHELVEACTKESFFDGQHIITQNEEDDEFYVVRRGKVEFLMDGEVTEENITAGQGCESTPFDFHS
jgi:CRP-like cAMP-binding protein